MAEEEVKAARERMAQLQHELQMMLLPKDPNAMRCVRHSPGGANSTYSAREDESHAFEQLK